MIKDSYIQQLYKTLIVIFLFAFLLLCFYLYESMPRGFTCESNSNEKKTYFQGRFIPWTNTLLVDHLQGGITEFKCEKNAVLSCVENRKKTDVSDVVSLTVYRMNFSMVLKGKAFVATAECMWNSDLKI